MRLPKKAKKNKPSKYAPIYSTPWTWEQIYRHWIWPYTIEVKQITYLKGKIKNV